MKTGNEWIDLEHGAFDVWIFPEEGPTRLNVRQLLPSEIEGILCPWAEA